MSWDSDRVRIEMADCMVIGGDDLTMTRRQSAEIRLSDDEGKIRRQRKPDATLVAETRPELLRMLANWIESRDDPSLSAMALETAAAKRGGTA